MEGCIANLRNGYGLIELAGSDVLRRGFLLFAKLHITRRIVAILCRHSVQSVCVCVSVSVCGEHARSTGVMCNEVCKCALFELFL